MADEARSHIRRATPADVPALVALREVVAGEGRWIGRELPLPGDFGERLAASIDDPASATFVAEVDGVVVGDGGLHANGARHGAALLDASVEWARARPEIHKVVLQVWPHNEAAISLYRRAGFVVEGYRHRHWRRADGSLWDVIEMGLLVDG